MKKQNDSKGRPNSTGSEAQPQLESLLGMSTTALQVEEMKLGDVLDSETVERLALHLTVSEQSAPVAVAAAVQLWLDMDEAADDRPAPVESAALATAGEGFTLRERWTWCISTPDAILPVTTFIPRTHSLASRAWAVDELAYWVAFHFNQARPTVFAALFEGEVLAGEESAAQRTRRLGAWAELLAYSYEIAQGGPRGEWEGCIADLPGLGFAPAMSAHQYLEWMAVQFADYGHALALLADRVMKPLPGRALDSLSFVEALLVLEQWAVSVCKIETKLGALDRRGLENPLQTLASEMRQRHFLARIAEFERPATKAA